MCTIMQILPAYTKRMHKADREKQRKCAFQVPAIHIRAKLHKALNHNRGFNFLISQFLMMSRLQLNAGC